MTYWSVKQAKTLLSCDTHTVGMFSFLSVLISEFLGICDVYVVDENIYCLSLALQVMYQYRSENTTK